MKKLVVFIVLILSLFLGACSAEKIQQVNVYETDSFSTVRKDPLLTITNTQEIEDLVRAFNKAKKVSGVVDVANPDYFVEAGEDSYFLWIEQDQGSIMHEDDSHTLYSFSKKSAKTVYELIN